MGIREGEYTTTGLQVTLPACSAGKTLAIQPLTDFLSEPLETVQVNVSPTVHYRAGNPSEAVVRIEDDCPAQVSVVASDASADRSGINP